MTNSSRLPIATLVLIAINMLAAFWVLFDPQLATHYGFIKAQPGFAAFVTGLFFHQNLLHLAGNMLFLAAVGPAVEFAAGSWRFLAVYFCAGIVGTLAHWALVSPAAASVPLIGASGCIAGCVAYYAIRYIGLRVPIAPNVGVPMAVIAVVWIALQAGGAFVQIGEAQGGTAFWSHLGGFAAGLVLSLTFRAPSLAGVQLGHEALEKMNQRGPGAALAMAERHLAQHPDDVHALLQKATAQENLGDREAAAETLARVFDVCGEEDLPEVVERLEAVGGFGLVSSLKRTLTGERIKADSPDAARLLFLSVVEGPVDDGQRPEALLALVGLDLETDAGRRWLKELSERYPLHPTTELARSRGWLE